MRIRTVVGFASGPVISALLGALILPITAWIFSPEDIGRLNVLQTLTPLVLNGVFLGLDQAYVREFHESKDKNRLFSTSMMPSNILLLLASVPVALFPKTVSEILFGLDSPILAWGTLAALHLSLLTRQRMLSARMNEKALSFSLAQILPKFTQLIGVALIFSLGFASLFPNLLAIIVASHLSGFILILIATSRIQPLREAFIVDRMLLKRLLRFGLPTMVAAFTYVALSASGTIMLRLFSSFNELGVYALTVSIAGVVGILQSVFSTVWSPIVYRAQSQNRAEEVIHRIVPLTALLFGAAAAVIGCFSWILPLILPNAYEPIKYLVIGATITPLMYLVREVSGIGINISRRVGISVFLTLASLILGLILGFILVPVFGAAGAVAANVVALWVLFVLSAEISARIWFSPPRFSLHLTVGTGSILSLASLWLGANDYDSFIWLWMLYGLSVVIFNRTRILSLIKSRRFRSDGGSQ